MAERIVMARAVRSGTAADGRFDAEFWSRLTGDARMAAAWGCVLDLVRLGRLDAGRLRLRRDVVRIERGGR